MNLPCLSWDKWVHNYHAYVQLVLCVWCFWLSQHADFCSKIPTTVLGLAGQIRTATTGSRPSYCLQQSNPDHCLLSPWGHNSLRLLNNSLNAIILVLFLISISMDGLQLHLTYLCVMTEGERDPNAEVLHWMECMRLASHCYDLKPPLQNNG